MITSTFTPTAVVTFTNTPTIPITGLLAYYPLSADAIDASHHYGAAVLHNAPFADSGASCNGIYKNAGDPNYCEISTPPLTGFDYSKFTIMAGFKAGEKKTMPVFVGGSSYRWIGFYLLDNGHVALLYNNSNIKDCGLTYTPGYFYEATVSYDGATAKLYLNGTQACSQTFALQQGNDRDISVTNYSNGATFKGIIKDLRVYNTLETPSVIPTPVVLVIKTLVVKPFPFPVAIMPFANYPLHSDANDAAGHYGPMTVSNASFADGGVSCAATPACNVRTPNLDDLNFGKFSIAGRFNPAVVKLMPVFVGGHSYRWIGYYLLANGHVGLKYNNSNLLDCGSTYTAGTWYDAVVTYDGTTAKLYLNGDLACTQAYALQNGGDRDVGLNDPSTGNTFVGVFSDLKVYNAVITP